MKTLSIVHEDDTKHASVSDRQFRFSNTAAWYSRIGRRAVRVNIEIMRTFVRLRRLLASHADLAKKLSALEHKYDRQFKVIFDAIKEIMKPKQPPKQRQIGFLASDRKSR